MVLPSWRRQLGALLLALLLALLMLAVIGAVSEPASADVLAQQDELLAQDDDDEGSVDPAWTSLLPPLLAIGMALATRQIIPSLIVGVWVGAWLVEGVSVGGILTALLDVIGVYVVDALSDPSHVAIIVFTLMIGGMVGIVRKNGGTDGIVNVVTRWTSTPRRAQVATSGLGIAIFFDDYTNTLVVGNTMRPITDRLRVSREKLAYLVDSTAAPVATVALVTTWIGFQVGLIENALADTAIEASGYSVFLQSLRYAFYPFLAILFVFAVAISGRDFGPMLRAERRAREHGEVLREGSNLGGSDALDEGVEPPEGTPRRVINAVLPIATLIGVTAVGLYVTGEGDDIVEVVGDGDAFSALLWGSMLAVLVAALLSVGQRILTIGQTVDAWFTGIKSVLYVMIILTLAWALSGVTGDLGTGEYLASTLGDALPIALLPAILFIIAAAVAFATGTSWGTMGILTPLAIPLAWAVLEAQGLADPAGHPVFFASVSTILAGAVWGDHCSPISDTTVISSLASQCDVIDHVKTQLPYALVVGAIAIVIGLLPVGLGLPWWAAFPIAAIVTVLALRLFGEPVQSETEARPATDAR